MKINRLSIKLNLLMAMLSKLATSTGIRETFADHARTWYPGDRFHPIPTVLKLVIPERKLPCWKAIWEGMSRYWSLPVRRVLSFVLPASLVITFAAAPLSVAAPKVGKGKEQPVSQQPPPGAVDAETNPAFALPQWGDGQWGSSEHYGTIQTADLDGDGIDELLGRSGTGLEAWYFDGESGQWMPLYVGGLLGWTDKAGWEKRSWYETIGTADLDGDGADDVFGRTSTGIEAYSYDKTTETWIALPRLPQYTDAQDWNKPKYYSTIQAADLDGDGKYEIFGRGADGLEIRTLLVDGTWELSLLKEFTDEQGWDKARFYSTIQTADLDGDGKDEIIGRSAKGMTVWGLDSADKWVIEVASGPFPDATGWDNVQYYSTISTADLDGDGSFEVYGRGARTLSAYLFNYSTKSTKKGTWIKLPVLHEFTDKQGWNKPEFYATIQGADLDGDGRDELIGRGNNGMRVWGLDPSSKTWTNQQQVAGPGFTNALGWNKARYYKTIQTADIDGFTPLGSPGSVTAPRMELIGRGPSGIQTYRFGTQSGSWLSPSATFPIFTGTALIAYDAINSQLFPTGGDVRSHYDQSATTLDQWAAIVEKMTQPANIPIKKWQGVKTQIITELGWAAQAAQMFENASQKIDDIKELEGLDVTAEYLEYDTSNSNDSQIFADLIQLFAGVADAVSNLGAPGVQVVFGTIDAVASVAFSGQNGGSTFEGKYIDLRGKLEASWGLSQNAVEQAKQTVMADYGLLQAVGGLFNMGVWEQFGQSDPGWADSTNLSARAYSVWVWQVLTPTLPKPCGPLESCEGWIIAACTSKTCLYKIDSSHEYELWTKDCNEQPCSPASEYIVDEQLGKKIPSALHKQMFDHTSSTCLAGWDPATCNYEIPVEDVFLGRHGWTFQCSLWYQTFWDAHWLKKEFCQKLANQAAKYGAP